MQLGVPLAGRGTQARQWTVGRSVAKPLALRSAAFVFTVWSASVVAVFAVLWGQPDQA